VPQIPASLQNVLERGNCSFYYGAPTNKARERLKANLAKAGVTTNSAQNLIRSLVQKTCGVKRKSPSPSPRPNNERSTQAPLRRSARTARRA
jgi:hypothetical protein